MLALTIIVIVSKSNDKNRNNCLENKERIRNQKTKRGVCKIEEGRIDGKKIEKGL